MRSIVRAFLLVVLLTPAAASAGSISFNSAEIIWAGLQVTTDPGLALLYESGDSQNRYGNRLALSGVPLIDDKRPDWDSFARYECLSEGLDGSVFGVVENRIGDAPNLHSEADVRLEAGVEAVLAIRATVQRVAFFRAQGNGELHISVPYQLSSTVISDAEDAVTGGTALAYLQIDNARDGLGINDTHVRDMPILSALFRGSGAYAETRDGIATVHLPFFDGDVGAYQIWSQTSASVTRPIPAPEPGTLLYLSVAALGVAVRLVRG